MTITVNIAKANTMTGYDLLKEAGIMENSTIYPDRTAQFRFAYYPASGPPVEGKVWYVYTTSGRGKNRGTYVHLLTHIVRKVVLPDGTDTGNRIEDVLHMRVKADRPLSEAKERS